MFKPVMTMLLLSLALGAEDLIFRASFEDTDCIGSGDQTKINSALTETGSVAVLCKNSEFALTAPIVFSADGQQVYTEDLPDGNSRALLKIASPSVVTAVVMIDRSDVVLKNVIVDGSRPQYGHLKGDALILAGGRVSGQIVSGVKAFDTRSWSILHLFEGGEPHCSGALVENNEFGPAGQSDGTWADGISMACSNSLIRNNLIVDATDGGIVIFAAPGSLIENNVIRAENRVLLGGINMVDWPVYEGNYTNTRVHQNVIDAAGATIRVALGMGWRVWTCLDPGFPDDVTIHGGVVTDNTLQGDYMQYGYTVDGVRDWTVTGNVDLATHSGTPVVECNGHVASSPAGFLKHGARAQGVFQSEFEEANVELALWAIEEPVPAKVDSR